MIRLLETDSNRRGDLFARLVEGYFLSLGYDHCRLNIHKTGREIDVRAAHRTESRIALAECKAVQDPIGGDSVNKFVGVLSAEQDRAKPVPITGYYVSLSGFKESAVEQEEELTKPRVVLTPPADLVSGLIGGRIIISREGAAEAAGRVAASATQPLVLESDFELLGHEIGWIWALYFRTNAQRSHFALIHADGQALSQAVADDVVAADQLAGGTLCDLHYLAPPSDGVAPALLQDARDRYLAYIANDYGWITLEGLPADREVGSRQLALEALFVPLHLEPLPDGDGVVGILEPKLALGEAPQSTEMEGAQEAEAPRIPVGEALVTSPRLVIQAPPGGGKSTLLKRLAVAYAFPGRQQDVDDNLPPRDFFPLILRCRQLGSSVTEPITELLAGIPHRAEMPSLTEPFVQLTAHHLHLGTVLLLVDGVDEIADEGDRVAFAKQLRTFLATYPGVSAIITSREAAFRVVAPALATACDYYRLSPFSDEDIHRLTSAWHKEVVGDAAEVARRSSDLARRIVETDRVRRLAENPLLLTTLLLVHRWVGELPRKRTTLYSKAIEVLLMTWNVEGHRPIDPEEANPQLAFVAHAMLSEGAKTVSIRRLRELLTAAREEMPEILAYTKLSVGEFVNRVEDRSSVLSLSGHGVENGKLVELYEFKHLTFQEYLAAVAIAESYLPRPSGDRDPIHLLKDRFADPEWEEVVPLAAVMLGRRASPIVEELIDAVRRLPPGRVGVRSARYLAYTLLAQSIADEVQISPQLANRACDWLARRHREGQLAMTLQDEILSSRYGDVYRRAAEAGFMRGTARSHLYGSAFTDLVRRDLIGRGQTIKEIEQGVRESMTSSIPIDQAKGAVAVMVIAFYELGGRSDRAETRWREMATRLGDETAKLAFSSVEAVQFASCWALAWLGIKDVWHPDRAPTILARLLALWRHSRTKAAQEWAAWALASLPIVDRTQKPLGDPDAELTGFLVREEKREKWDPFRRQDRGPASLIASYYLGSPWDDDVLAGMVLDKASDKVAERLLAQLNHPLATRQ